MSAESTVGFFSRGFTVAVLGRSFNMICSDGGVDQGGEE